MGVAFPEEYSNWQKTDLHDLIDAELVPEPTDKNVVKAVRKLAKEADAVVIATDFDREGELIGHEALQQALEANPAIANARARSRSRAAAGQRARYSALTKDEIERAFDELDELSYDLAYAGAARQDIDLIWGATLTRAVSLATRRFGSNFLSVGRVQSPTLGLIVERELERRAHVPKPFWEVFAKFEHPDGSFEAHHATDKFWDEAEAEGRAGRHQEPGRRQGREREEVAAQAADAAQHHGVHDRRVEPARDHPGGGDAPGRGPLHGRVRLLPADRQHRLPGVAAGPRAGAADGPDPRVRGRRVRARRADAADPRQEGDHRPPADPPDPGRPPERARRRAEAPRLRADRPPLHRHLRPADGHRVDPRRHRGRLGELLRPRLGRARPRLRPDLHLRPLLGRRDPEAGGGPGAGARRRAVVGRQGDAAAVADQPGQADRADGGARPRHQGDPRGHHPEALRPRLRLLEPAGAVGDRASRCTRRSRSTCRGWRRRR